MIIAIAIRIILRTSPKPPRPAGGTDAEQQQISPRNGYGMKRIHVVGMCFTECNVCSRKSNEAGGISSRSKLSLILCYYDALDSRNYPIHPSRFTCSNRMIREGAGEDDASVRRD